MLQAAEAHSAAWRERLAAAQQAYASDLAAAAAQLEGGARLAEGPRAGAAGAAAVPTSTSKRLSATSALPPFQVGALPWPLPALPVELILVCCTQVHAMHMCASQQLLRTTSGWTGKVIHTAACTTRVPCCPACRCPRYGRGQGPARRRRRRVLLT